VPPAGAARLVWAAVSADGSGLLISVLQRYEASLLAQLDGMARSDPRFAADLRRDLVDCRACIEFWDA